MAMTAGKDSSLIWDIGLAFLKLKNLKIRTPCLLARCSFVRLVLDPLVDGKTLSFFEMIVWRWVPPLAYVQLS
jgi:hypothetical protein